MPCGEGTRSGPHSSPFQVRWTPPRHHEVSHDPAGGERATIGGAREPGKRRRILCASVGIVESRGGATPRHVWTQRDSPRAPTLPPDPICAAVRKSCGVAPPRRQYYWRLVVISARGRRKKCFFRHMGIATAITCEACGGYFLAFIDAGIKWYDRRSSATCHRNLSPTGDCLHRRADRDGHRCVRSADHSGWRRRLPRGSQVGDAAKLRWLLELLPGVFHERLSRARRVWLEHRLPSRRQ